MKLCWSVDLLVAQVANLAIVTDRCLFTHLCLYAAAGSQADAATLTLRGFTYQAIGQLSQRVPSLFQQDTDIAARCFDALSFEPAGVKAAVQEATSLLSAAYHPSKLKGMPKRLVASASHA